MRVRVGYSSYLATTLDYRESKPIVPSRLEELVTRLRAGDRTVADEIIKGHLRLVAGIVAEMVRKRHKVDDAMGAALLSLVETVIERAPTALKDNNITPYVGSWVRHDIKDHLANDHVVRVPGRTVRYRIAQGEEFEDIVPGDPGGITEDITREGTGDGQFEAIARTHNSYLVLPFHIPVAGPPDPRETPEFREALSRAAEGALNEVMLKMRVEGHGYEEIGKKVGLSLQRVAQVLPGMVDRLTALVRAS